MKFLCGCTFDQKRNYAVRVKADGTMTNRWFDREGFEVCPEHGMRATNWKSDGISYLVGNRPARAPSKDVSLPSEIFSSTDDKRDNRDPQEVWSEIQASRFATANGHS